MTVVCTTSVQAAEIVLSPILSLTGVLVLKGVGVHCLWNSRISCQPLQPSLFRGPKLCNFMYQLQSRSFKQHRINLCSTWFPLMVYYQGWFCLFLFDSPCKKLPSEKYENIFWIGGHSYYFTDCQNQIIKEVEISFCYLILWNLLFLSLLNLCSTIGFHHYLKQIGTPTLPFSQITEKILLASLQFWEDVTRIFW